MPSGAVNEKKTGSGKGLAAALVLCALAALCALGMYLYQSRIQPPAPTPSPAPTQEPTPTPPPPDTEPPVIEGAHDMTAAVGMTLSYRSGVTAVDEVDGKVKLASGSVYSFYQFEWPLNDRLTDAKWCQMMGISPDEEGIFNYDTAIAQPQWTQSYRFHWE